MNIAENIMAVAKQLRKLFSEKNELCGFNDWDALIGCVMLLEDAAAQLNALSEENKREE